MRRSCPGLPVIKFEKGEARIGSVRFKGMRVRILEALSRRPGRLWTSSELIWEAWRGEDEPDDALRTLSVTVHYMRERLSREPVTIQGILGRGGGYRLVPLEVA